MGVVGRSIMVRRAKPCFGRLSVPVVGSRRQSSAVVVIVISRLELFVIDTLPWSSSVDRQPWNGRLCVAPACRLDERRARSPHALVPGSCRKRGRVRRGGRRWNPLRRRTSHRCPEQRQSCRRRSSFVSRLVRSSVLLVVVGSFEMSASPDRLW